ncbi:MAG: SDR family NAD(P)-dependent oxidoreductase [Planctomycetaceae bacterium]|jgi:NAD(P)-dependent dehydrogenase (short-subunit alcohol dehydrogenase family)|nr:SDR family NAD(P)-dependent oxidoreductase [Planctomycetaceae bacterium]
MLKNTIKFSIFFTAVFLIPLFGSADATDVVTQGKKVWFITGTSSGFGLETTKALLERGDSVAATALEPDVHKGLQEKYGNKIIPLRLDVTKRDEVKQAVEDAVNYFGRLDVVVNNAGCGYWGAIEELTEEDLQKQFDVNVFGSFRVIQAVLPIMRQQKSGHIIQISSRAGLKSHGMVGAYCASKWAVEAINDALSQEVTKFGIKVSIVEPGSFYTEFYRSIQYATNVSEIYAPIKKQGQSEIPTKSGKPYLLGIRSDDGSSYPRPENVVKAILKVADTEKPPLRILVGDDSMKMIPEEYEKRLKEMKEVDAWLKQ